MEDFRNKMKNYTASPNDLAWERMLIKQEKRGLAKTKTLGFALLALNAIALLFWAYQAWNISPTEELLKTEPKNYEVTSNEKQVDDMIQINLKEQNKNKLQQINLLIAENNDLKNQILQLQNTVQNKQTKISQLINLGKSQEVTQNTFTTSAIPPVTPRATVRQSQVTLAQSDDSSLLDVARLHPLPLLRNNNSIPQYLIQLASKLQPTPPLYSNRTNINNNPIRNWYISIGSNYENLIEDSQKSLATGLHRSLNKRFDVGVILELSKTQERGNYRINNDIKDHRTETSGQLILRYKAFRFNKVIFHADAGIGYRFGSISNRQHKVVDNEIQYYNEVINYNGIDYQFALGAMYEIKPQLSLGTRFFLDTNLHTNINLNYRF